MVSFVPRITAGRRRLMSELASIWQRCARVQSPSYEMLWSGEDVRYSVVRWAASETRNAQGPSVSDPRTGEIIESDIVWYHNHMRSYRNRLMVETGAANPLARTLDTPETLMGETMRQVIAHEVGHALGLPHNWIASAAFPVDSLRSPSFTEEYGVAASIMEYARQNYIAQLLSCSRNTIAEGSNELTELPESGGYEQRVRRPGGGRKRYEETYPAIDEQFLAVMTDHTAGDPMDEQVRWTNLSRQDIADRLAEQHGVRVSVTIIKQLLAKHHYRQRKAQKKSP